MMRNDNLRWPDFLVIGAGKCGTTSLDQYLKQHPKIFMSPVKEPNFYGLELLSEEDFESGSSKLNFFRNCITDQEEYLGLFKDAQKEQLVGEISNTYLYHEHACSQIKNHIPNAKLIAIFRQPAERLFSRYLHLARENKLPTKEFSDCLDRDTVWWTRDDLINEGFYYRNLSKFYEAFDSNQMKVFLYEDLISDPQNVMHQIFEFLGVAPDFEPDMSVQYNSSGFIQNKFYDKIIGQRGIVRKLAGSVLPKDTFIKLKNSQGAQRVLNNMRRKNLHKPKLDIEVKRELTEEIYGEDINNLSKLIGRDLSHWRMS